MGAVAKVFIISPQIHAEFRRYGLRQTGCAAIFQALHEQGGLIQGCFKWFTEGSTALGLEVLDVEHILKHVADTCRWFVFQLNCRFEAFEEEFPVRICCNKGFPAFRGQLFVLFVESLDDQVRILLGQRLPGFQVKLLLSSRTIVRSVVQILPRLVLCKLVYL